MDPFNWAPEHSGALQEYLALGMTYSEIARAINAKFGTHYSRNATISRARRIGLGRYLRLNEFTHYNTDGPGNPYALVYDRRRIERDFPSFRITRTYKRFMHAPPLPVHGLPGQSLMGWHLWAHLTPVQDGTVG